MNAAEFDPIGVVLLVTEALERMGTPYFVGGSLASALYGSIRATADADIVADLDVDDVERFVAIVDESFFVDSLAVRTAVRERRSFNIFHRDSMFKVDVFLSRDTAFDASQLSRCVRETLSTEPTAAINFASAEDTVLAKLVWFRSGSEVSERQWRDVLEVVRTVGDDLDRTYILEWADSLGILDLWIDADRSAQS